MTSKINELKYLKDKIKIYELDSKAITYGRGDIEIDFESLIEVLSASDY